MSEGRPVLAMVRRATQRKIDIGVKKAVAPLTGMLADPLVKTGMLILTTFTRRVPWLLKKSRRRNT
ncbi:hypothetical protein BDI4_250056 [Burkholderia diffusa]|nr:hypothetical protein BDI4_250056 [Burkholderia diffusa]